LLFFLEMRVLVSSPDPAIGAQTLAYAEFRIFSVLTRYPDVCGARVVVRGAISRVRCSVTIEFASTPPLRARATGPSASGTIDRCAQRVVDVMRRRAQPESAAAT
jgi:hypothetical protein